MLNGTKIFRIHLDPAVSQDKYEKIVERLGWGYDRAMKPVKDETRRGLIGAIDLKTRDQETAEWVAFERLWLRAIPNKYRARAKSVEEIFQPAPKEPPKNPTSAVQVRTALLKAGLVDIELIKRRGIYCFIIRGGKPIKTRFKKVNDAPLREWLTEATLTRAIVLGPKKKRDGKRKITEPKPSKKKSRIKRRA